MPNMCRYNIKLNGTKKACYAFAYSQRSFDELDIVSESGSEEEYELNIFGSWGWGIEYGADIDKYEGVVDLDSHSLEEIKSNPNLFKLYNVTLDEKARVLNCSVEFSYSVTEGVVYGYVGKIDNNGNLIEEKCITEDDFDEEVSDDINSTTDIHDKYAILSFDDIDNPNSNDEKGDK